MSFLKGVAGGVCIAVLVAVGLGQGGVKMPVPTWDYCTVTSSGAFWTLALPSTEAARVLALAPGSDTDAAAVLKAQDEAGFSAQVSGFYQVTDTQNWMEVLGANGGWELVAVTTTGDRMQTATSYYFKRPR